MREYWKILGRASMTSKFGAHLIGNPKISKVWNVKESNSLMMSEIQEEMGLKNEVNNWKVTGLTNGTDVAKYWKVDPITYPAGRPKNMMNL